MVRSIGREAQIPRDSINDNFSRKRRRFHFFLRDSKKVVCLGLIIQPTFVVSDACDAHFNAVSKVFPDAHFVMCFFHVMSNVKKHFEKK